MLILALIPFLLLELYLSLYVGERIGFVWSAVWIVVSMIVGVQLLRLSPFTVMGNLDAVRRGKLSLQGFQNVSSSYLIGALLLIVPGVLSDAMGVLVLLYTVYLQFVVKITPEKPSFYQGNKGEDNVIDVEVIDKYTDHIDRT